MYIPTIFFGGTENCVNLIPNQSTFPTGSNLYGQLGPEGTGSEDSYFYVICNPGEQVNFTIQGGATAAAKLLLIGGGGGADELTEGGGAAGDVLFEDIPLVPGNYFLSSSAFGGSGSVQAGDSIFVTNIDEIPANRTTYTAFGGNNGSSANGASNTNFTGGTGATGQGGGGGAGSRGNGGNASGDDGGDGGTPFTVPFPFNQVTDVNTNGPATPIAGGGGGKGQCGDTDGVGKAFNEYGSGGSYDFNPSCSGGAASGVHGAAMLFVPIRRCQLPPSGAIDLPSEQGVADGGDIIGTFTSGSDTFKYHIFINGDEGGTVDGIFSIKTGSIQDAKILCVAGGGGGSPNTGGGGAGGVTITRDATLYGMYSVKVGDGGAVQTDGTTSSLDPISSFVTYIESEGGGAGAGSGGGPVAQSGGSGAGGGGVSATPGNALSGSTTPSYNSASLFYGSSGGIAGGSFNEHGGGGGGATSNGGIGGATGGTLPNGGDGLLMTGEFFPTNVWVTGSIARGGDGGSVAGGSHPIQPGAGDGGHGGGLGSPNTGSNGFVSITYKI
tara:strand:+ start:1074 stop:2732 length:1659 start_codon:yes stop_codon:yes gene_type:complete